MLDLRTVKGILIEAKELITKSWSQKSYARNLFGLAVDPFDDEACSYCIMGALRKTYGAREIKKSSVLANFHDKYFGAINKLKMIVYKKYGINQLYDFNDHPNTTKDMVLEVFNLAITECNY